MNYKVLALCAAALLLAACSDDDEGGKSKVTGPIATPGNVVYTPTEDAIHFEWSAVENATSYETTLAPEDTPSDKETITTASTYCDFENLESGYYVFTIMALYEENPEFNSDVYEMRVATLGLGVAVLDAPGDLDCISVGSHEAVIMWNPVSGAAAYEVKVTASGTEVLDEIVTTNTYTIEDLESNTRYTASVKALLNSDGTESEFDSPESTVSFTTVEGLVAPSLTAIVTTYGLCILEFDVSAAGQVQQPFSSSDPYEFRVLDEDRNLLRTMPDCNSWNFNRYSYKRVAVGGLEPKTVYILGIRRISQSSSYGNSDWTDVQIMTEEAPDKSGYLLYWDFENVPFCADPQYRAYGFKYSGNSETDYSDANALTYTGMNNEAIWGERINPAETAKQNNQSFFDNYMPGITVSDWIDERCYNLAVSVGIMKFGGSSLASWLTLPAFDFTEPTDVLIELDSSAYFEPGSTGDKYEINNTDNNYTFNFDVTGDGYVDNTTFSVANDRINGAGAVLTNPTLEEGNAFGYGDDRYYFLPHSFVLREATKNTVIKIYPPYPGSGQSRMWMDNLKISVYTED